MLPLADVFSPDLSALLAPLAQAEPAGESLRYSPIYAQIREARLEEDQNLPMGEWTRPLKKADWKAVETLCFDALTKSTKDLQIAGWLTEAWTRRHGLAGLVASTQLLDGLCRNFWNDLHPQIEDDDVEIRVAPFFWINDNIAQTLLLHVALMPRADQSPAYLSLSDWQRAVATEFAAGASRDSKAAGAASRQDMLQEATQHIAALVAVDVHAQQAADLWETLTRFLDDKLGEQSPSLSKVTESIKQIRLALRSLLQDRDPRDAQAEAEANAEWLSPATTEPDHVAPLPETTAMQDNAIDSMSSLATAPSTSPGLLALPAKVTTRAEAYRLLELAATFLEQTEPHSPTPYLIRRAITWGRLSLPELMQEVIQEEGDISRYFSLLGIKS